jgi:Predicted hydrolases or acyltransferases (alpha/beta hydrolase superfamily)
MGPPLDEFVEVRGARLRVRTAGEGPAVLFIHGWAIDLDMWTPQFAALARRYRLIAFDRRGFGYSSGSASIDHDLADIEQLLVKLDVDSIAIVGMSQGARVALRWAMYAPRATTSLILDGPPQDLLAMGRPQGEIALATYRELVREEGIDAFRRHWMEHPLMRLYTTHPRAHALLREMVGRYPGNDLVDDAMRPDMPILIINGEHDTQTRIGAGADLARALPHAQLAIIPEAGHLSNLDNPGAYNQALDQFLAASHRQHRSTCHAE